MTIGIRHRSLQVRTSQIDPAIADMIASPGVVFGFHQHHQIRGRVNHMTHPSALRTPDNQMLYVLLQALIEVPNGALIKRKIISESHKSTASTEIQSVFSAPHILKLIEIPNSLI